MLTEKGKELKEKIYDTFDYSYSVSIRRIDSFDEFRRELYTPFLNGEKIYYRGERLNSKKRLLVPSLLRNGALLQTKPNEEIAYIDREKLLEFYEAKHNFMRVYKVINPDRTGLYEMLAFAQHYLKLSPLIDFSKSLFVALSFALKGRQEFKDDVVLYTAFDIGDDDTSDDLEEVNAWIDAYRVAVVDIDPGALLKPDFSAGAHAKKTALLKSMQERELSLDMLGELIKSMSPEAKLIDIPTNDLMKYQQGVFLLLNHFALVSSHYFTKSVRQSFAIHKYVLDRQICPELCAFVNSKAPQYQYEALLDIAKAVR